MSKRRAQRRRDELRKVIDSAPELPREVLDIMGPEFEAQWRDVQARLAALRDVLDDDEAVEAGD